MTDKAMNEGTQDVPMDGGAAASDSQAAATDVEMQSETGKSTAADSIVSGIAASESTGGESVPRKSSNVKNPDEQIGSIYGKVDKSESEEEVEPPKSFKGLQNQGATCYMNSLLQALFMTPDFRQMIYKFNYDPEINSEKKDCILFQLQKLFATLQVGKLPYASTSGLTNSFGWNNAQNFEQQDVQEFMRVLFDAIEQSFEQNKIYGVIDDLYTGVGSGFIKCSECGYQSKNEMRFSDLQLPIKNEFEGQTKANESIEESLFKYLCPTTLEGDNAYSCSGCGKKVTATKGDRLDRLPKILTLQLQRFTLDMRTWQRKKLDERVTFPLTLNMNHFLDEAKQNDEEQLAALIAQNPLKDVRPSSFTASQVKQAQANAKQRVAANDMQKRYEENLQNELGQLDDANIAPSVKGTAAQQRAAEAKRQREEHKKNLQKLKAAGKKRKGGFDRSKLNPNFMANTKTAKDETAGWAFDFDNPDSGNAKGMVDQAMVGDDATLARVMNESLKESMDKTDTKPEDPEAKPEPKEKKTPEEEEKEFQEAEKKRKKTKRELIKKIEAENSELLETYLKDGPFVYELYAVMIHQGGALGGHYFAYIKDIESGKWFNFNDSIVREMSLIDLCEAFGPEPLRGKMSAAAAKRLASARSSSAYMLMYRIIDMTEDRANLMVDDDEIPQEAKDEVESAEVETQNVRIEKEKQSQKMQLKVIYRPKDEVLAPDIDVEITQRVYYVNRVEDTYAMFFDTVYKDIIGDQNPAKQRENFRLRAFNVQHKIMLDTWTGRENETLRELKIYPMKTLVFEEKLPSEVFQEYDPNSMLIKVNFWRAGLQSLAPEVLQPIELKVQKEMLMSQFLNLIVEENRKLTSEEWTADQVQVLKRNPLLNTSHLEILSNDLDKQLTQLRINEGVNLFIENKTVHHPQGLNVDASEQDAMINMTGTAETPKWEIEHELDGLRFQVRFNTPSESSKDKKDAIPETAINAQQILDAQLDIYKHYTIVDRRISVYDLKVKISQATGVSLDTLVFRRGGAHGVELLEDEDSLKQAQFYNHICLYLEIGQPSVLGQRRLTFFLAKSSQTFLQQANPEDGSVTVPDNCFFSFEELASFPCSTASKVSMVKQKMIQHLSPLFPHLGLDQLNPNQIRLREKTGEDKLTTVFKEQRELSRYQIFDGKEIGIQILPEVPTETQDERENSYLVMVKLWDPSDWTLSELVEFYVPRTATLDDFANLLSAKFPHIPSDQIECAKINSSWNFSRVQLPYESWTHLQKEYQQKMSFASAPYYVQTDGCFFVIRDIRKDGRDMTDEEKALYRTNDFEQQMFSKTVIRTGKDAQGNTVRYNAPVEHGVKITVKSKAQATDQESAAATDTAMKDEEVKGE